VGSAVFSAGPRQLTATKRAGSIGVLFMFRALHESVRRYFHEAYFEASSCRAAADSGSRLDRGPDCARHGASVGSGGDTGAGFLRRLAGFDEIGWHPQSAL